MSSAVELQPYRVEWRPNALAQWAREVWAAQSEWPTLEEATTDALAIFQRHKGQVRVVEQRVVMIRGLGLNVTRAPSVQGVVNPLTTIRQPPT